MAAKARKNFEGEIGRPFSIPQAKRNSFTKTLPPSTGVSCQTNFRRQYYSKKMKYTRCFLYLTEPVGYPNIRILLKLFLSKITGGSSFDSKLVAHGIRCYLFERKARNFVALVVACTFVGKIRCQQNRKIVTSAYEDSFHPETNLRILMRW